MFKKVLIANRGAIACRIIRTLRRMGIGSIAVFSEADSGSLHVREADEAVCIGPSEARLSYLNGPVLIAAAQARGGEAVHPGYGFLSENAEFAEQCAAAGLVFVGPTAQSMRAFGLKHRARELAKAQGVPLLPGTEILPDVEAARIAALRIGFPVMLKATAGGGGIGMRVCVDTAAVDEAFPFVERLGSNHFGDAGVYLERFIPDARHVEVQIFGDGGGRVIALGERDCSLQRRNQKIIEETPAPGLSERTRRRMVESAVRLGAAVGYRSAGTVEFLFDAHRDEFFFLEVNTRLQVEHGITEEVTGVDLVEWMVRCAAGECSFLDEWSRRPATQGCAIQARLYAEDPAQANRPSSGTITELRFPSNVRVDTWVAAGTEVSTYYDPLLAKLIVKGADRAAAVMALQQALDSSRLAGLESNLEWLRQIVRSEMFVRGEISTGALASMPYTSRTVRVLTGGLATTVQDYPGRLGYWQVGVPPSGPMDSFAFRLGNRLLGNDEGAAGLEVTALGPSLLFDYPVTICLVGADCAALLDGTELEPYTPIAVSAGQTLKLGRVRGPGMRSYVLFRGGLDVPLYLRSRATFTLGRFGGHAGRNLVAGDVLHLTIHSAVSAHGPLPAKLRPPLTREWRLRVLYGPHGAPDFFTGEDIEAVLAATWKVHYNSNRTGVRLIGPKPRWARRDGGEAGLHPSNIHDNAYAIGALDFTGDMPIILGPDGPSLGGFVCPFVVIQGDLWKLGQLAPGDDVRLECVDELAAAQAIRAQEELIAHLERSEAPEAEPQGRGNGISHANPTAILETLEAHGSRPRTLYRRQGDRHVLVEYGPIALDLTSRLRVHALMLELEKLSLPGVIDITPGIRSLQVQYDSRVLPLASLMSTLIGAEDRLGALEDFEIPSRVIWLPLSFNDPAVAETIARYMSSVRPDAPWCPDNIEFIRRINGLASAQDVRRIVFDARYLVMGLGDVYLGAPVAVPLDPRHRLVTTKYNPARTWTPPNVVGIGGAYLCIYGMEGPGGYQLFGRTIQVWNSYLQSPQFHDAKPWLLRFFDQIRFFPVTPEELIAWRRDFPFGRRSLRIETEMFRLRDYQRFLQENRAGIESFQASRQAAFDLEREEWARRGEVAFDDAVTATTPVTELVDVPEGAELVEAPLGGNVWKVHVQAGDSIEKGSVIAAIEAMKTECNVPSPASGVVRAVYIRERQQVAPGMPIIALEPSARQTTVGG
ncbi:MAG: urea carboxylase [Gammaproteobacteria bacterium]|nr:urea carboxylase [Gammaproteobacteria bacterium]